MKWHKVTVSFNEEELEVIRKLQVKHKVSRSKAIRSLVIASLSAVKISEIINSPNSILFEAIKPVVKTTFSIKKVKEIETMTDKATTKISEKKKQKIGKDLSQVYSDIKKFTEHNRRGAPKKPKRKRGRQKDTGI